jgi:hypothetical protein
VKMRGNERADAPTSSARDWVGHSAKPLRCL